MFLFFGIKMKNLFHHLLLKNQHTAGPYAKHELCRPSPKMFSDSPKNVSIFAANLSCSGQWITLNVNGHSDGITGTLGLNTFSPVMLPVMTVLSMIKLQLLHHVIYSFVSFKQKYNAIPLRMAQHIFYILHTYTVF